MVEVHFAFLLLVSECDADRWFIGNLVDSDFAGLRSIDLRFWICDDLTLFEPDGEVEQFEAVFEDNKHPVSLDVKVDDLHAWIELNLACDGVSAGIPEAKLRWREVDVVSSANNEKDVGILVRVTDGSSTWDLTLDFRLCCGGLADCEPFFRTKEEMLVLVDET